MDWTREAEFILEFLRGEHGGEILPLGYEDPSGWKKVVRRLTYYVNGDELLSLRRAVESDLSSYLARPEVVIDIGPGTAKAVADKTLPILQLCRRVDWYSSLDVSEVFARLAAGQVAKRYPRLTCHYSVASAFPLPPVAFGRPTLFLLMGGTGMNMPFEHCIPGFFHWLRRLFEVNPQSLLLTSFDTNTDPATLGRAYAGDAIQRCLLTSMERRLGHFGFRAGSFSGDYHWDVERQLISVRISALEQVILERGAPAELAIVKGRTYEAGVSIKLPEAKFRDFVRRAGAEVVSSWRDPASRIVVYIIAPGSANAPRLRFRSQSR